MQVCLLCALSLQPGSASVYIALLFHGLINNCMDLFLVMHFLRLFILRSVIKISLGNVH